MDGDDSLNLDEFETYGFFFNGWGRLMKNDLSMSEMGYNKTMNSNLQSGMYTDGEMVQGTMLGGNRAQSQVFF